jgi:hypothetical protein
MLSAQPKPLVGNAAKNALMPRARDLARTGRFPRWLDVMLQFGEDDQFALRTWLTDADKDELEMLHKRKRGVMSASRRRRGDALWTSDGKKIARLHDRNRATRFTSSTVP